MWKPEVTNTLSNKEAFHRLQQKQYQGAQGVFSFCGKKEHRNCDFRNVLLHLGNRRVLYMWSCDSQKILRILFSFLAEKHKHMKKSFLEAVSPMSVSWMKLNIQGLMNLYYCQPNVFITAKYCTASWTSGRIL